MSCAFQELPFRSSSIRSESCYRPDHFPRIKQRLFLFPREETLKHNDRSLAGLILASIIAQRKSFCCVGHCGTNANPLDICQSRDRRLGSPPIQDPFFLAALADFHPRWSSEASGLGKDQTPPFP